MKRRRFVRFAGAVGFGGLAGCTYNLSSRSFELNSSPVTVPNFLIDQTFIEDYTIKRLENTETIEYQGERRKVNFESWITRLKPVEKENIIQAWFYVQPDKQIGNIEMNRRNLEDPRVIIDSIESKWSDFIFTKKNNTYTFNIFESDTKVMDFNGYINGSEVGMESVKFLYFNTVNEGDEIAFMAGVPNNEYENDIFTIIQASDHPSSRSEVN
jgi:hypothetical protein